MGASQFDNGVIVYGRVWLSMLFVFSEVICLSKRFTIILFEFNVCKFDSHGLIFARRVELLLVHAKERQLKPK